MHTAVASPHCCSQPRVGGGIGKRSAKLNKAALKAAKAIGPVQIDYGDTSCEPLDVVKHLTSDYVRNKLGT